MPREANARLSLPPTSLLPAEIKKAAVEFEEARQRRQVADQNRHAFEQVEVPAAKESDTQAAADAIEKGSKFPAPKFSEQAQARLNELTHIAEANAVVEARSRIRLEDTITSKADLISKEVDERLEKAQTAFTAALDDLAKAASDLTMSRALKRWSEAPLERRWKVPQVSVPASGRNEENVESVIASLRRAGEPPVRRCPSGQDMDAPPLKVEPEPIVRPAQQVPASMVVN